MHDVKIEGRNGCPVKDCANPSNDDELNVVLTKDTECFEEIRSDFGHDAV
jgi:hypothetical protein